MKSMMFLATLFAASFSFAADLDAMSWEEILAPGSGYAVADKDIEFQNPVGYGITKKNYTDADLCVADGVYDGGSALIHVCTGQSDNECSFESFDLSQAVNGTKLACAEYVKADDEKECVSWVPAPFPQPSTVMLTVTTKPKTDGEGNVSYDVIGQKAFTVKACPSGKIKAN